MIDPKPIDPKDDSDRIDIAYAMLDIFAYGPKGPVEVRQILDKLVRQIRQRTEREQAEREAAACLDSQNSP